MKLNLAKCVGLVCMIFAFRVMPENAPLPMHAIQIIDGKTGRGVPLVQLETVSRQKFITDSAGLIAIVDPALIGQAVFFTITSHGYEFPADGFGIHGKTFQLKPGEETKIKINRINIAERIYRITGEGIYRDSIMLGRSTPLKNPLINGQVVGQDSAHVVSYQKKLYWFFGDTQKQSYPLGQFSTSGAFSELPATGGLDPNVGVNLTYFVDAKGFSRPMYPPKGAQLHWVDGVVVTKDAAGNEKLIGTMSLLKSLADVVGRELVMYDDKTDQFQTLKKLDLQSKAYLSGHPFHHQVEGVDYIYFGNSWPNQRMKANWADVLNPEVYESYKPDFDKDGKCTWAWRIDPSPITNDEISRLIKSGRMKEQDAAFRLKDIRSKKTFIPQNGSVVWNDYRKKFVMIISEVGGATSYLGEIYYAESDHPQGPWGDAVKVVTHDRYSFYNPVIHPIFDQENGRYIYFEGTYTYTFSRKDDPTPMYDYNQIMYRLDLADDRLRAK